MKERISVALALATAVLMLGCSDQQSVGESKGKIELSEQKIARIVFSLPGDDIGSQESRLMLEKIEAALLKNGVGDIISSGFGMGSMEIVVSRDRDKPIEELRRVIDEVYPKGRFRIEFTTNEKVPNPPAIPPGSSATTSPRRGPK